jgi:hypothetical protein
MVVKNYDFKANLRFEWASGFYNSLVKWWFIEVEGWKECNYKQQYFDKENITARFHIDSKREGENWLEYEVSGEVVGEGEIHQYYESGIASGLRRIIVPALTGVVGYLIGLTVTVTILYFAGEKIAKEVVLPIAIGLSIVFISAAVFFYVYKRK